MCCGVQLSVFLQAIRSTDAIAAATYGFKLIRAELETSGGQRRSLHIANQGNGSRRLAYPLITRGNCWSPKTPLPCHAVICCCGVCSRWAGPQGFEAVRRGGVCGGAGRGRLRGQLQIRARVFATSAPCEPSSEVRPIPGTASCWFLLPIGLLRHNTTQPRGRGESMRPHRRLPSQSG